MLEAVRGSQKSTELPSEIENMAKQTELTREEELIMQLQERFRKEGELLTYRPALRTLLTERFQTVPQLLLEQINRADDGRSRRGTIRLPVRATRTVTPGSIFIPFHFREAAANVLTLDALDPHGKIPRVQVLRRAP